MTTSVLQESHNIVTTSGSVITAALSNTTPGSVLHFFAFSYASNTCGTPTDTQGNTFTLLEKVSGSGASVYHWYAKNIAGGVASNTVSVSCDGGNNQRNGVLREIGGFATVSPLDGHIGAAQATPGTGADGITTGSSGASTNANQPALISASAWTLAGALSAGTGFSVGQASFSAGANMGGNISTEQKRITATGAQAATATTSLNNQSLIAMAIFDEAATLVSISVTPANPTITNTVGNAQTKQFTATGTYNDSSQQDITNTSTWNSGTPATATVNASTGLATSVLSGTTTIQATKSAINGSTTLTVAGPVPVAGYSEVACTTTSFSGFSLQQGSSPAVVVGDYFVTALTTLPSGYSITVAGDGTVGINAGGDTSRQYFQYYVWRLATNIQDGPATVWVNEVAPVWGTIVFLNNQVSGTSIVPVNLQGSPYATSSSGDTLVFALASGALPTGVTLTSGGIISGTPSVAGTFTFTISATDYTGTSTSSGASQIIVLTSVVVPNVIGETQAQATTDLAAVSLIASPVTSVYSATVPIGIVFNQVPAAGTSLNSGSSVNLYVSLGPAPWVLLQDAITLATQAGLMVLRPVKHAYSSTVPYGYVIAQSPASGATVPIGTMVLLTASDGTPPPPGPLPNIPNVVGMARLDAEKMIEDNGCNVNPLYTFQFSNTYAQGLVVAQSLGPMNPAPAGTVVRLTISLGIQITYVGATSVIVPVMH